MARSKASLSEWSSRSTVAVAIPASLARREALGVSAIGDHQRDLGWIGGIAGRLHQRGQV